MIRELRLIVALVAILTLQGCALAVPAAIMLFNATCKSGEILTTAEPNALDGHPVLQAAEQACEALAP